MNENKCALISYLVVFFALLSAYLSPTVTSLLAPILIPIGFVCIMSVVIIRARRTIKWLKSDDNETK